MWYTKLRRRMKRKRVFRYFQMGNIRATSDLSQGKVHMHNGMGLKWLIYYPFGNT